MSICKTSFYPQAGISKFLIHPSASTSSESLKRLNFNMKYPIATSQAIKIFSFPIKSQKSLFVRELMKSYRLVFNHCHKIFIRKTFHLCFDFWSKCPLSIKKYRFVLFARRLLYNHLRGGLMMTLEMDWVYGGWNNMRKILLRKLFIRSSVLIDIVMSDIPLAMAFNQYKKWQKLSTLSSEPFFAFYFLCSPNDE